MRFGIARDLITPDIAMHLGGYANFRDSLLQGIHDDLYVKCVLLDDGTARVILLALDLLFHDRTLSDKITGYLEDRYAIAPAHVLISYTHTHAAPATAGYDVGQSSPHYDAFLWQRIQSCIDRTFINTFAGQLAFGPVEGDWNVNRRLKVDGVTLARPNYTGVKDNSLNILKIIDEAQRVRGLLLNYGCHPVTLRDQLYVSGEYPGRLCQLLESAYYGCTATFFQGAGGNSRPRVTAKGDTFVRCNFNEVDDMALAMANNVQKVVNGCSMQPVEMNLAAVQFVIPLPLDPFPKSYFEGLVAQGQDETIPKHRREFYANAAQQVLATYDRHPDEVSLHAGIIRLSPDLYIAHMGGETCYEVKEVVARAFDNKEMLLFGYGDSIAYIVDDSMLADGGYEVDETVEYGLKGRFKPGLNQRFYEAYRQHFEQVRV
jgi:neutral ceramidase